jgi:predicted DNA-binding ribbon-helix-helix protein
MLVNRNITVDSHRTSIRLEPEFWAALADIAQREKLTVNQLCTEIDEGADKLSRTAAIRLFIVSYFVQLSFSASEQLHQPTSPDVPIVDLQPELIEEYVARGRVHQLRRRHAKAASNCS